MEITSVVIARTKTPPKPSPILWGKIWPFLVKKGNFWTILTKNGKFWSFFVTNWYRISQQLQFSIFMLQEIFTLSQEQYCL